MVVLLIVLAGSQYFLWRWVRVAANSLQDRRTQAQQLANLKERLGQIDDSIASQQQPLTNLDKIFPNIASSSEIVERLELLTERRGLQLEIKNIKEEEIITSRGPADIVPLVFLVNVIGNSDELLAFLDDLEHLEQQLVVRTWTLESFLDRSNPAIVAPLRHRMTVEITFYLQRTRK